MSFDSMAHSLTGEVPGVPLALVKSKLNEALGRIYDSTDWSFQTQQGGWLAPGLIASTGTFTVTPYSATLIGNAAATAALTAVMTLGHRPFITELQFRNPAYSLYNIIAADITTNAPFVTLTLDRPWAEPLTGAGISYFIYQAYFPAPSATFRKFIEIRDTTNGASVSFTKLSQDDLSRLDPQRLLFGPCVPTYAVPWGVDQRVGSATLGYVMYELWPHVLSNIPFSFSYKVRGTQLVNPTDTVPYPLTEALVTWRAKEILYQFKESQKGEQMQRGSGADWRFLSQAAAAEYLQELKLVRAVDANLHRDFLTRNQNQAINTDGYSTNRLGQLNVGSF